MQSEDSQGALHQELARALLRSRAERYASIAKKEQHVLYTVVTFARGQGRYALPLTALREIRPLFRWCSLPGTNPVVLGMVHFRGELLSLHDLSVFASGKAPDTDPTWMLVAEHGGERMGLLADDVMDVLDIEAGNVQALPITLGEAGEVFLGMTDVGVLIVDTARMFEASQFISAF